MSQVDGANTYYYLADGLGSTMKTIDASGNVVNAYTYDVYGEVTNSSGSQGNEFDFTGQQTDPTGLQYPRARYYDTETGIFISRDPLAIGASRTANSFTYVAADPVNASDPLGLCKWYKPWECKDQIVDGMSGASGWVKHQIASGAKISAAAAKWAADVGWNVARAAVNSQLSAWALGLAKSLGCNCHVRSDGIIGCAGVQRILDILGSTAITIGNVILTHEYSFSNLRPALLAHEIRHADQWALAGMTTMGVSPLIGQAGMLASYGAAQGLFKACGNPFEIAAGLEAGGYKC